jgi:hypothetical protein
LAFNMDADQPQEQQPQEQELQQPADDGYVVPADALLELPNVIRLPHPAGGEL